MQKIQIKDIQITLQNSELQNIIETSQQIAIDINGKLYNDKIDPKAILVFQRNLVNLEETATLQEKLKNIFTDDYRPQITNETCTIKPLIAWQEVMKINTDRMLYLDHPTDGIENFNDSFIEDLCFEAVVLDIEYRDIADFIENNCEGTFVYYENDIQFSGFAVVDNIEMTRKQIVGFLQSKINEKLKSGELDKESFDGEQETAYELIFSH